MSAISKLSIDTTDESVDSSETKLVLKDTRLTVTLLPNDIDINEIAVKPVCDIDVA